MDELFCHNLSRFKIMSFRDIFFLMRCFSAIACFDLPVPSRAAFAARARSNCLFGIVSVILTDCGVTTARVFFANGLLASFLLCMFVLSLVDVSKLRSFFLSLLFMNTKITKSTTMPMSMNKAMSSACCPSAPDVKRMPDVSITIGAGGGW